MSEGGLFGSFLSPKRGFCSDGGRILCVFRIYLDERGYFFLYEGGLVDGQMAGLILSLYP